MCIQCSGERLQTAAMTTKGTNGNAVIGGKIGHTLRSGRPHFGGDGECAVESKNFIRGILAARIVEFHVVGSCWTVDGGPSPGSEAPLFTSASSAVKSFWTWDAGRWTVARWRVAGGESRQAVRCGRSWDPDRSTTSRDLLAEISSPPDHRPGEEWGQVTDAPASPGHQCCSRPWR